MITHHLKANGQVSCTNPNCSLDRIGDGRSNRNKRWFAQPGWEFRTLDKLDIEFGNISHSKWCVGIQISLCNLSIFKSCTFMKRQAHALQIFRRYSLTWMTMQLLQQQYCCRIAGLRRQWACSFERINPIIVLICCSQSGGSMAFFAQSLELA